MYFSIFSLSSGNIRWSFVAEYSHISTYLNAIISQNLSGNFGVMSGKCQGNVRELFCGFLFSGMNPVDRHGAYYIKSITITITITCYMLILLLLLLLLKCLPITITITITGAPITITITTTYVFYKDNEQNER